MPFTDSRVQPLVLGASPLRYLPFSLAFVAVVLPTLLAFNLSPSATFLNQAIALAGWGMFAAWAAFQIEPAGHGTPGLRSAQAALLLLAGASVLATVFGLPASLVWSSLCSIAAALVVLTVAAELRSTARRQAAFEVFCAAMLLAGFLSLLIVYIQYFVPEWADGNWIARMSTPGRAGGNLRQPNHLSSLLLWSMAALVWLHDIRAERVPSKQVTTWRAITTGLLVALVFGVVLTVSRTGAVCVLLLAAWGVVDRRLSRFVRVLLWLAPIAYALCWMGVTEWAQSSAHPFAGGLQLHKSDPSSSRFGIWANTISLIEHHPWVGVGWGQFNFAWTLTPFPGRPVAFFDHTHNLPLQLLVELGIPLGTLVLALLAWALWKAFAGCRAASADDSATKRCSFMMVLMMIVHSMLEYPLWYAYFLLPMAFAFGLCLGSGGPGQAPSPGGKRSAAWLPRALVVASLALALGSVLSVVDYMRVVSIFVPPVDALPLSDRIDDGQHSWFFAHHADYASVTSSDHPSEVMPAFKGATSFLLDTRLMMAWAKAWNERGDVERARYLAQRLKEFHNPQSEEFFAECEQAAKARTALPFQCTPPTRTFTYEDFR